MDTPIQYHVTCEGDELSASNGAELDTLLFNLSEQGVPFEILTITPERRP